MVTKQLELHDYVPHSWLVTPNAGGVKLAAPSAADAALFYKGAEEYLKQSAQTLGAIEVTWDGCSEPIRVKGATATTSDTPVVSSYGPSSISSQASYEEVTDFIAGKKQEGLVVTVTSMISDKCLMINDLQVLDRGGGWTGDDWVGIDFKKLWKDSFHLGKTNYYGQLIQTVERDHYIPDFLYNIRRPSGALAEYTSSYYYVENFLQVPARIAISKVGDWRIIEPAPNGSE